MLALILRITHSCLVNSVWSSIPAVDSRKTSAGRFFIHRRCLENFLSRPRNELQVGLPSKAKSFGGGRMVRRCWIKFQGRGVLLIWIIVGQGPIALAVGAGGGVWAFFLSSITSLFFLPLSGRRPDID